MDSELQKALDVYNWNSPPVGWSDDAIADLWFDLRQIVEAARKVADLDIEAVAKALANEIAMAPPWHVMSEKQKADYLSSAQTIVDAALGITEDT